MRETSSTMFSRGRGGAGRSIARRPSACAGDFSCGGNSVSRTQFHKPLMPIVAPEMAVRSDLPAPPRPRENIGDSAICEPNSRVRATLHQPVLFFAFSAPLRENC